MAGDVNINMNLHQSSSDLEFNLPSLNRTRMTRIARIFTDPCASVSSVKSVFYRSISLLIINEHKKNSELKRTETNSGGVSSYGVRTSSLLIFINNYIHQS
jgi:hypothetical protein